jgi:hypothetical protein
MTFTELPDETGTRYTGDLYSISHVDGTEYGCGTVSEIRAMVDDGIYAAEDLRFALIWTADAARVAA